MEESAKEADAYVNGHSIELCARVERLACLAYIQLLKGEIEVLA